MRLGVPREREEGERRVAVVPESVPKLVALGLDVQMERGAGAEASFPNDAYAEAGAQVVDDALDAEIVAKVAKPTEDEVARLRDGGVLAPRDLDELLLPIFVPGELRASLRNTMAVGRVRGRVTRSC